MNFPGSKRSGSPFSGEYMLRLFSGPPFDQPALVRDEADGNAANAHIAANHFLRKLGLELVDLPVVDQRANHLVHVVRHAVIRWEKIVEVRAIRLRRAA